MNVTIKPGRFKGVIRGISSKSLLHRMLFCASACKEETVIYYRGLCEDVKATVRAVQALGAEVKVEEERLVVRPSQEARVFISEVVDCGESGSTLRFFLPMAAARSNYVAVTGSGRLPQRPVKELLESLIEHKKTVTTANFPIVMKGSLTGGRYEIPGNVSSQYLSGLLMMAPLLNEDVIIKCSTELESKPYVDMTIGVMEQFGVQVRQGEKEFLVGKEQHYCSPGSLLVESDWSNAAFFIVANACGQEIEVPNLYEKSWQGDAKIKELVERMQTSARRSVDLSQIPDLVAPLAILAAVTPGVTEMVHGERLRLKESDRIESTRELLKSLGGTVTEIEDGLRIEGNGLQGGRVNAHGDHRIAMAAGVAACVCKEPVVIVGAEAVNKSYPYFFEELQTIGGNLKWEN
ncbi:3-phosphoshikimate 1-carboxyvinyltransferase [Lachnospiraceae bacterium XBB1006]|nr:3-phosphoshikimate 1-carboxyvinyltransferase [Lachnospiraceae bacterium XBB1006]